jgi:hypothetical protein
MGGNDMIAQALLDTAEELFAGDRGILAMDESIATCNRRFAAAGIEQQVESRRAYRELLVSTPRLLESIRAAILYDETIRQRQHDGTPMIDALTDAAIIPGIKLDAGTVPLARQSGERITEGLDGLRPRLADYARMGLALPSGGPCSPSANAPEPRVRRGERRRTGALRRDHRRGDASGVRPPAHPARGRFPRRDTDRVPVRLAGRGAGVGKAANVSAARQALSHRARCDQMARRGEYTAAAERTAA